MLKESKKLLAIFLLLLTGSFSVVYADESAFIPGSWASQLLQNGGVFGNLNNSLFGSGGYNEKLVNTNCRYDVEDNPYAGQKTNQLHCDPKVVSYYSSSQNSYYPYYTQPATNYVTYQQPSYVYSYVDSVIPTTYYTTSYSYSQPYSNQSAIAAYSGSNIWYPCDRSGYCDEGLFNTYYRDGRGDVTGFYDDPRLCFDGGPNCTGQYDGIDGLVYYPNDDRQTFCDAYGCYDNAGAGYEI